MGKNFDGIVNDIRAMELHGCSFQALVATTWAWPDGNTIVTHLCHVKAL